MVYADINMNAARWADDTPCINPAVIMYNTAKSSNALTKSASGDGTGPDLHQDLLMDDAIEQPDDTIDDTMDDGGPPTNPEVIRCKLSFAIAAHKTVPTGKEFVAVARIPYNQTIQQENPFVNAQGKAYHYDPEIRRPRFNTSITLTPNELANAACNDQSFVVHVTNGTSFAPAGNYLIYRLKRSGPGTRNLRFEATWDSGKGVTGTASYDLKSMVAHDDCEVTAYTWNQKILLDTLWPEWTNYIEC
ncbi:hypothetical protein F4825DRAFT_451954 [Nemania diffusa]|nr:hypothetical protein F4825DRAFT_451954 [Nemania diffusa]